MGKFRFRRALRVACIVLLFGGLSALGSVLPASSSVLPASSSVPPAPVPPRLVNDFAGILGAEAASLEHDLTVFADTNGAQITVVTVNTLGNYDAVQLAVEIGELWGVGGKKNDNGVVLVVKPKNGTESGEVGIATGYGVEGALPDAICHRIIEEEMIPRFREGDYAGGVRAAAERMMSILSGEEWEEDSLPVWVYIGIVILVFAAGFALIVIVVKADNNKGNGSSGGAGRIGPVIFFGGSGHGSGRGGAGGGFGTGGGFGGFGGGSFGGGGAGGRW